MESGWSQEYQSTRFTNFTLDFVGHQPICLWDLERRANLENFLSLASVSGTIGSLGKNHQTNWEIQTFRSGYQKKDILEIPGEYHPRNRSYLSLCSSEQKSNKFSEDRWRTWCRSKRGCFPVPRVGHRRITCYLTLGTWPQPRWFRHLSFECRLATCSFESKFSRLLPWLD